MFRASELQPILVRALLLAALWGLLSAGDAASWLLGVPAVMVAAAWRLAEVTPPGLGRPAIRLRRLFPFIRFFVWHSLVGSCDVAWRALHYRLPIDPRLLEFNLRLPGAGPARVFFANCLNLLPGTLNASWDGDIVKVHVLTSGPSMMASLRTLEHEVGLLFGHELPDWKGGES